MVKIQRLIYWSKDIHFLNLVINVAFSLTMFPIYVTLNYTEKSHHFFSSLRVSAKLTVLR